MTPRWLCLVAHLLIGCLFWPYHYCLDLSVIGVHTFHFILSSPVLSWHASSLYLRFCSPFYDLLIPRRLGAFYDYEQYYCYTFRRSTFRDTRFSFATRSRTLLYLPQ